MNNAVILSSDTRTREQIVGKVLNALDQGPPWDRHVRLPTNPLTGWHFTGITALMLDVISSQHGYQSQYWAKAENWSKCGGEVCGPGHEVPYEVDGGLEWLRLWHAEDVRGADRFQSVRALDTRWDKLARLLSASRATVIHEDRPFPIYDPPQPWSLFPNHASGDTIYAPPLELCRGPAHYWTNMAHELFHWAEVRTDWLCLDMPKREFVAELGSAWLLRYFGLRGDGDCSNFRLWQPEWREAILADAVWLIEAVGQVEEEVDCLLQFRPSRLKLHAATSI